MTQPTIKHLLNPVHCLALGLGSGLLRPAPGTWGTLAGLPIWYFLAQTTLPVYAFICAVSFVIGIYLCGKTAADLGVHDHGAIVWDEFVGLWVTLLAVPMTPVAVLIGFVLFRLFDIVKPWPIRWLDKHVEGGFGIMLDDLVAALMAGVATHLIIYWVL